MAVAGEVKVTAGAGATLRSMRGSPREVEEPALLMTPDMDLDVDMDAELCDVRSPV